MSANVKRKGDENKKIKMVNGVEVLLHNLTLLLRGFLEDPQRQEANGTVLFPLIDINTCVRKSTYQHINLPLVLRPCWSIFLGD